MPGPGRKGWLTGVSGRDLFKITYGFGLRRNEIRDARSGRLRHRNPAAPQFGRFRRLLRPLRQGDEGRPAAAARTVLDGVGLDVEALRST